jgi:hypothetical protein
MKSKQGKETMIQFKAGDKVRVGNRVGKVLSVIQGRHAGTLLVDIPKHNQTWGHYKPSELTRLSASRPIRSLAEIAWEKWDAS